MIFSCPPPLKLLGGPEDRIERNSFASTFKSNYSCIYYYFTLQLGTFVIFSCPPPLKLLGGGGGPEDRIERNSFASTFKSNQITVAFIITLPFNLDICDFFLFHIEIEGKGG